MKALITGIEGQDGAYLSHYLTCMGHKVIGICRRNKELKNLNYMFGKESDIFPSIIYADITETKRMYEIINEVRPDEIYNLAAQSHVGYSFENPSLTMDVNYKGLVNIIDAVKKIDQNIKIYQASTSELYGYNRGEKLNEESAFAPRSPYAIAKLAAHWACINAREEGVWASNGILFNHESPLRGEDFVTRKITIGIGKILKGENHVIELGNIYAKRDWGFAGDYVKAMHAILQYDKPDDFVIGTGIAHSVKDFLSYCCEFCNFDLRIEGHGEQERWYDGKRLIMRINPQFYRPNDVKCLIADPLKAYARLGWKPETGLKNLIGRMIEHDRG